MFPDITMTQADMKEDLSIIETEDLKSDPFVRKPPIKPAPPVAQETKPKAKRQVSEKQKAHLANARKMARERKLAKKKEEESKNEEKQDIKEYATQIPVDTKSNKTDMGLPATQAPAPDGFEQFLGYMDRYGDMMLQLKQEEEKKRLEEEKKEKELEAKYFKKFQEQQKKQNSLDTIQNDVMEKEQPVKGKKIPKKNLDILNQKTEPDYGPYSSYF